MSNFSNIVENIVNQISNEVIINEVNVYILTVCDTSYTTIGKIVEDGAGNQYTVLSFIENESITLEVLGHTEDFDGLVLFLPKPLFLAGTPQTTNQEYLNLEQTTLDKTPFIWLLENYDYDGLDADSAFEAVFNGKIFFLDWFPLRWSNKNHNDYAIKPMESLKKQFVDIINESFDFRRLNNPKTIVRPRFGVYVDNKGNTEKILDTDFSGVELRLKLEVYDLEACKC